jgi:peptidoglycan-associated lipoprotein
MIISGGDAMKKHVFLAALMAALLAGCSSVKLDDVPVEDRKTTAVDPRGTQPESKVAAVTADPTQGNTIGPANVPRIVYFDYDSYVIKPEFQNLIESHARFLKTNNGRKIMIEGHTDERGGREYNLALGQRRSEAVRRALNLLGVTDSQMEAVSFGEEKPAAPGSEETAWSKNRRAEIAYR